MLGLEKGVEHNPELLKLSLKVGKCAYQQVQHWKLLKAPRECVLVTTIAPKKNDLLYQERS